MPKLDAVNGVSEPLTEQDEQEMLDKSPGVPADVIQAPGIIKDSFSNKTWTLPSDSLDDGGFAIYKSPRDISKDPNFHYEFCRANGDYPELAEKMSQGFVPVTRKELGLEEFIAPGQPSPMDEFYLVDGHDICVKIPRILADRRYAAMKRLADAAKEGVKRNVVAEDGQNLDMNAGGRSAGPVERNLRSRTTRHEPTRDELA